jgi:hypothetical protein
MALFLMRPGRLTPIPRAWKAALAAGRVRTEQRRVKRRPSLPQLKNPARLRSAAGVVQMGFDYYDFAKS